MLPKRVLARELDRMAHRLEVGHDLRCDPAFEADGDPGAGPIEVSVSAASAMRGASIASWMPMPKSTTFTTTWNCVCPIVSPPGVPRARKKSPVLHDEHRRVVQDRDLSAARA